MSLLHGIVPMLCSVPGARDQVIELRYIACRVDSWSIGLRIVDEDATIHIDAAVGEKTNFRANPDSIATISQGILLPLLVTMPSTFVVPKLFHLFSKMTSTPSALKYSAKKLDTSGEHSFS